MGSLDMMVMVTWEEFTCAQVVNHIDTYIMHYQSCTIISFMHCVNEPNVYVKI